MNNPFSDLYTKLLTDWAYRTNSIDAAVFAPQWMADYRSCISKKRNAQALWMITSVSAGFIQARGTSEGAFFDPDTMKPLVNNDAFGAALDVYLETTKYGPPDEINLDVGDTRGLFTSGRCAQTVDWGDIGTLAIDPNTSKVQDKVGAVILPGSRKVLDRATGEFVPCDSTRCPHAINGINHAPFAAFGGWSGGINAAAKAKVKDAAYEFFSYKLPIQVHDGPMFLLGIDFKPSMHAWHYIFVVLGNDTCDPI